MDVSFCRGGWEVARCRRLLTEINTALPVFGRRGGLKHLPKKTGPH